MLSGKFPKILNATSRWNFVESYGVWTSAVALDHEVVISEELYIKLKAIIMLHT